MLLVVIRTRTAYTMMSAMRTVTQVSSTIMIAATIMRDTTTAVEQKGLAPVSLSPVAKRISHLYVQDVNLVPAMAACRVATQLDRAALFPPAMLTLCATPFLLGTFCTTLIRAWLGSALSAGSKNANGSLPALKTLYRTVHLFARG